MGRKGEGESGAYNVVLATTVILCALEYTRWHLLGIPFCLLASVSLLMVVLPTEFDLLIDVLKKIVLKKLNQDVSPKISSKDDPVKIISMMNIDIDDESIQEEGLKALVIITDNNKSTEQQRKSLVLNGISPLIMRFLKNSEQTANLKLYALRLLKNFGTLEELKQLFEDENNVCDVSIIVNVMRDELSTNKQATLKASKEKEEDKEKEQGEDSELSEDNQSDMVDDDTSDIAQMSRKTVEIERLCVMILGSLCDKRNDLKTIIFDEGFVPVSLDALDWFRYHRDLTHWILWSLFNLTFNHTSNKVELIRRGALASVVSAMQQHKTSLIVQRQAVALLFSSLMQVEDTPLDVAKLREAAYIQGMIPAIEAAITNHPRDPQLKAMGQAIIADSKSKQQTSTN